MLKPDVVPHKKITVDTVDIIQSPKRSRVEIEENTEEEETSVSNALMNSQIIFSSEEDVRRREAQVIRFNSTMGTIKRNSKFYLGLLWEIWEVVNLLSERAAVNIRDIFIVLKKIKLNDSFMRIG